MWLEVLVWATELLQSKTSEKTAVSKGVLGVGGAGSLSSGLGLSGGLAEWHWGLLGGVSSNTAAEQFVGGEATEGALGLSIGSTGSSASEAASEKAIGDASRDGGSASHDGEESVVLHCDVDLVVLFGLNE